MLIFWTKQFPCYLLVFRDITGAFLWQPWLLCKNGDRYSKCVMVFCDILSGTNWKTAMLVLSPLAFILGLIILTLNVHYNK